MPSAPMRVGINATCINNRPSGARQRFLGIFSELIKRLPGTEFVFFEPEDCAVASLLGEATNVSARRTPLSSTSRFQRFSRGLRYWPSVLAAEHFDLFESLHMPIVKAPTGQTLLTIHDVRGLHSGAGFLERQLFRRALQHSLRLADHVVTVSEQVRSEILGFSSDTSVSVVYNGLDLSVFAPAAPARLASIRKALALPNEFVLAVGHFELRKNYPRLLEAMARLSASNQQTDLVIVGNDSGQRKHVAKLADELGIAGQVHLLTDLTDSNVRAVYQLCELFVFPSLYEGFGIPILEAMAAGKPMVLSDIPVFREITQDRGVYFDPLDPDAIASRILSVLASTAEQERLVAYGRNRVRDFAFEALAEQMAQRYEIMLQARKC